MTDLFAGQEAFEASEINQSDWTALEFTSSTSQDMAVLLALVQVSDKESFRVGMSLEALSSYAGLNLQAVSESVARLERGCIVTSGLCPATGEHFLMANPCLCGELGPTRQGELWAEFVRAMAKANPDPIAR